MAGGNKLEQLELQEKIGNYEKIKLEDPDDQDFIKYGLMEYNFKKDDHDEAAMIDSPQVLLMKGSFKTETDLPKQGQQLLYLKKQVHIPTNLVAAIRRLQIEGASNHNSVISNHRALDNTRWEESKPIFFIPAASHLITGADQDPHRLYGDPDKDDADCSGCCSIM